VAGRPELFLATDAPPPDGIIRDAALLRIEFVSVAADTLTTRH
jgi:hypothetical protein